MNLLPHLQQYNLLFVLVGFFDIDANVFIFSCMVFIVTVSCVNFAMTAELELVMIALDCDSTSISYIFICMP